MMMMEIGWGRHCSSAHAAVFVLFSLPTRARVARTGSSGQGSARISHNQPRPSLAYLLLAAAGDAHGTATTHGTHHRQTRGRAGRDAAGGGGRSLVHERHPFRSLCFFSCLLSTSTTVCVQILTALWLYDELIDVIGSRSGFISGRLPLIRVHRLFCFCRTNKKTDGRCVPPPLAPSRGPRPAIDGEIATAALALLR